MNEGLHYRGAMAGLFVGPMLVLGWSAVGWPATALLGAMGLCLACIVGVSKVSTA
jgi:hypothetical protein